MTHDWRDAPEVPDYTKISAREVVARKEYICHACRKAIVKGQKHHKHVYLFEGEFISERSCDPYNHCIITAEMAAEKDSIAAQTQGERRE